MQLLTGYPHYCKELWDVRKPRDSLKKDQSSEGGPTHRQVDCILLKVYPEMFSPNSLK